MVDRNAKLCIECGSLEYRQRSSSQTYGSTNYFVEEDGSVYDNFESDDSSDDWEDTGDPECCICDSNDLADISSLSEEQFKVLYNMNDELRVKAIKYLLRGERVDPETGEPYVETEENPKKIGGYSIQQ